MRRFAKAKRPLRYLIQNSTKSLCQPQDIHKEQALADVERRYLAEHYVMVDDKLHIFAATKKVWGDHVTTVFPRQGKFALTPPNVFATRAADRLRGFFLFHGLPTNWTILAPHMSCLLASGAELLKERPSPFSRLNQCKPENCPISDTSGAIRGGMTANRLDSWRKLLLFI